MCRAGSGARQCVASALAARVIPPNRQPASTVGLAVIFLVFALGLVLQPSRWSSTPAYGNLLIIMPAPWWGLVHAVIAVVLASGLALRQFRPLAIGAHTLAFILIASWESAFIVRWATDPKTTIANVVAWGVYLALVVHSARHIDDPVIEPVVR